MSPNNPRMSGHDEMDVSLPRSFGQVDLGVLAGAMVADPPEPAPDSSDEEGRIMYSPRNQSPPIADAPSSDSVSSSSVSQHDAVSPASVSQHDAVSPASISQHDAVSPASVSQHDAVSPASVSQHDAVSPASVSQHDAVSSASVRQRGRRKKETWHTQAIPKPTGKLHFQGPKGFEDKVLSINKHVEVMCLMEWKQDCVWKARKVGWTPSKPFIYFCGLCGFASFKDKLVIKHFGSNADPDHVEKRKAFWGNQDEQVTMKKAIRDFEARREWFLGKPEQKKKTTQETPPAAKKPTLVPLIPEGWVSLKTRNFVRRTTILDVPLDPDKDFIFLKH